MNENEGEIKDLIEERWKITNVLLMIILIILAVVLLLVTSYPYLLTTINYLAILSSGVIGLSFRVKFLGKDSKGDKTVKDLRIAYYFIYPLLILVISSLILSIFTHLNYEGWEFYAAVLPIGFVSGTMGLGILGKISVPT